MKYLSPIFTAWILVQLGFYPLSIYAEERGAVVHFNLPLIIISTIVTGCMVLALFCSTERP